MELMSVNMIDLTITLTIVLTITQTQHNTTQHNATPKHESFSISIKMVQRWSSTSPTAEKLRNLFRGATPKFDPAQYSPKAVYQSDTDFQSWTYPTFKKPLTK
jgi:hypothetical protein